jgi:hypothetical protein
MRKIEGRLSEMDQNAAYAWCYRIYGRMKQCEVNSVKWKRLSAQYQIIGYLAATRDWLK